MERRKIVAGCVLLASATCLSVAAFAAIPPELPQTRDYEIFDPFQFAAPTGDTYGADVVSAGGPSCLGYSPVADFRLTTPPTTSMPAFANLPGYKQILRAQAGILYSVGHGNTASQFTVEAYENDSAGRSAVIAAANAYVNGGWGFGAEIAPVSTDSGYAVSVTGGWIQRMLNIARGEGLNPRHDIVVHQTCDSYVEALAFVNMQGLTRDYAGQTASVGLSTAINPSYWNQISSAIFNNMAGLRNDSYSGSYGNINFGNTLSAANNLSPTPQPPLSPPFQSEFVFDNAMPPAYLMRLYNAPRVVLSKVWQDTNLDGSYATPLYDYNPYSDYPYGSGISAYPGPIALSGQISASSAPIKISLQFSEPMDTATVGSGGIFEVQLKFSDGSTQDVSGSWSQTEFPNDSWTGTASFSSGFAQGNIIVGVRARRALCGSGLDTGVQELDTTGSGQSGGSPSWDTSTSFIVGDAQFLVENRA